MSHCISFATFRRFYQDASLLVEEADPFGLTVEDLKAGVSRIRNPVIARVLRELELMEKWGSGYKRIRDDCAILGHPLPEWKELGTVVRCVFHPHQEVASQPIGESDVLINVPLNVSINERQQWFLDRLASGEPKGPKHIVEHFGVAYKTATRDLAFLRGKGLIERMGSKKVGYYRLAKLGYGG
ncbi:MAG: DeoR family transcriptional regulator [Deltaproteobacteria bacterium]|nr:DeoR family transcriptional regulator [Deltaproteobacteria bacterium]